MEELKEKKIKYTFSGHDSFQCRQFWLKKGIDFVVCKSNFNDANAVVKLGVGKNMVSSIRYWLRAFGITNAQDRPSKFANKLLNDNGLDPYIEDDGSLWLLHYYLVKTGYASIYSIIYNEFRREQIEFNKESFLTFMKRKAEIEAGIVYNVNTLGDDFDVFKKMYLGSSIDRGNDEGVPGLFTDLGLIAKIDRKVDKHKEEFYVIENTDRAGIPVEVFLFAILDNEKYGQSISLNSLEHDYNSPGSIFAMSRLGLVEKIREAEEKYRWITYKDNAGVKELQLKEKPEPFTILANYYE